jgi:hypothetical protein
VSSGECQVSGFGFQVSSLASNTDQLPLDVRELRSQISPPSRDRVAIPFMVREPHHERNCLIENSSTYPFALSASMRSERIATQSPTGED